jgi:hypothetical protein
MDVVMGVSAAFVGGKLASIQPGNGVMRHRRDDGTNTQAGDSANGKNMDDVGWPGAWGALMDGR